jgi:hypothetical protein
MLVPGGIREYFREAMEAAMDKTGVELTAHAQVYVVHLMTEFSRAENAFAGAEPGERPALAILLSRAQESTPDEALRIYKHLGDSSLYFSGFFAESIERELVSRDYYVSMGETAYSSASHLARAASAMSSVVFAELADRFGDLVALVEAMSLHGVNASRLSDSALMDLIDRYRRTGSRAVLDTLKSHGVVLRPGLSSDDDEIH